MEYAQSGVDFNEVLNNIGNIDEANATVRDDTSIVNNRQMLADAYEQAASQVSNPYLTDVNTASAQAAEEALFRRIF